MNTLEALRIMRKGVLEQGYPSRDGQNELCHYWKHNRKCPIGMICPAEDLKQLATYDSGWQSICAEMPRPWMEGLNSSYMEDAQDLHDTLPDKGWLVHMVRGLDELIREIQWESQRYS